MVWFNLRKLLISQPCFIAQTTCDSFTSPVSLQYRGQTLTSYLIYCQQGLTVESETWRMSHSCSFFWYKDFFHEISGTENEMCVLRLLSRNLWVHIVYCICGREREKMRHTVQIFKTQIHMFGFRVPEENQHPHRK